MILITLQHRKHRGLGVAAESSEAGSVSEEATDKHASNLRAATRTQHIKLPERVRPPCNIPDKGSCRWMRRTHVMLAAQVANGVDDAEANKTVGKWRRTHMCQDTPASSAASDSLSSEDWVVLAAGDATVRESHRAGWLLLTSLPPAS